MRPSLSILLLLLPFISFSQSVKNSDPEWKSLFKDPLSSNRTVNAMALEKLDSLSVSVYNDFSGSWNLIGGNKYYYNNEGKVVREIDYNSGNTNVPPWKKNEYTYDLMGKRSSALDYYWDQQNSIWELYYKHEYSYGPSGDVIQILSFSWDDPNWEDYQRVTYSYSAGRLDSITSEKYDHPVWDKHYKREFYYGNTGLLDSTYYYDSWGGSWYSLQSRNIYSYNSSNQLVHFEGDTYAGVWYNYSDFYYSYDGFGNTADKQVVISFPGGYSNDKTFYAIDPTFSSSDLYYPDWYDQEDLHFNHKLREYTVNSYDDFTGNWIPSYRYQLYYIPSSASGLNPENKPELEVHPNPVMDHVFLDYSSAGMSVIKTQIMNSNGYIIREIDPSQDQIDVSDLEPGLYVLRIHFENGELSTTKILKR